MSIFVLCETCGGEFEIDAYNKDWDGECSECYRERCIRPYTVSWDEVPEEYKQDCILN